MLFYFYFLGVIIAECLLITMPRYITLDEQWYNATKGAEAVIPRGTPEEIAKAKADAKLAKKKALLAYKKVKELEKRFGVN